MPILGIVASSNYQRVAPDTGAMFPLGMVQVGSGGAANITFSSIPSTYKHLQIRCLARTTYASGTDGDYLKMQFNSDTGSNYATHQISGDGSSASAAAFTSQTAMYPARAGATGLSANIFGDLIIDVLDYSLTTKYKTMRNLGGYDANGSGIIRLVSGLWMNTNAVTSIKIEAGSGTGLEQYSSFALYGIKGA
jgi:hypothetical protein